jgi:hypothetical protein
MSKNLIVGWLYDRSFEAIQAFLVSAIRNKAVDTKVVILAWFDSGGNTFDRIRATASHDIELIQVEHRADDDLRHFISRRFCFYKQYLDEHPEFDNVMLTGLRDVIVQSDPFAYDPGESLLCFLESIKIGECGWNRMWLEQAYGKDELDKIRENWVSCAEIVMGKRKRVVDYVDLMAEDICGIHMRLGVIDQAVHNLLLWNGRLGEVRTFHPGEGPVFTMGYRYSYGKEGEIKLNGEHQVLNDNGVPAAVIHQYDRFAIDIPLRAYYVV